MKEATGELSTTVIAVVAIALISTLFAVFLYPQLKASIILNQACSNGPGYTYEADAYSITCTTASGGNWTCTYIDKRNNDTKDKPCSSEGTADKQVAPLGGFKTLIK